MNKKREFIPGFKDDKQNITLEHLLVKTSMTKHNLLMNYSRETGLKEII